ncbi:hypothetical protein EOD41_12110 [Mucilaginibacter limnophilus]|uniref:Uncharacterized protein n=1 Tax=Mucilaginibacter limnophilus TaxID=1932778 RepID=A0A3S2V7Y1_9SPHI|nr:hypothetical protein [Mucilaginibacter limnophilus]RVU00731.1 hypothetical protein EOD41_12110 [Mucilaginibacter limnophilus]
MIYAVFKIVKISFVTKFVPWFNRKISYSHLFRFTGFGVWRMCSNIKWRTAYGTAFHGDFKAIACFI